MTVGSVSGGEQSLTWTPPSNADRLLAIGLIIDTASCLYDREVKSIQHAGHELVTGNTTDSVDYYPHLGAVACQVQHQNLNGTGIERAPVGFKPWPGRLNDPGDYNALFAKRAQGKPLTHAERVRLTFAGKVPCQGFGGFAVTPLKQIKIVLNQLLSSGNGSLNYATLVCVEMDSEQDRELICQQPDLTDQPHWFTVPAELDAAADSEEKHEYSWEKGGISEHDLEIMAGFVTAHADESGTITYEVDHLQAVLGKVLGHGGKDIYPNYASKRTRLAEQFPQLLQHFDCGRRFDHRLRWSDFIQLDTKTLVSDHDKRVRLTFYGRLVKS